MSGLGADRLGEAFGAFELRGGRARPERLDAGGGERVDEARDQRRFRPDHHEVDGVLAAERDHRVMVGGIERDAFGLPRDAGIARRAPQLCHQRRGRDLPGQRVFAPAGAEKKNVHKSIPASRETACLGPRPGPLKPSAPLQSAVLT